LTSGLATTPPADNLAARMKLLFSEFAPDYSQYRYPYVVWAVPEPGETPADLYASGFHPASPDLRRFTLCRHLRVPLASWTSTSENRRILRKGGGMTLDLLNREAFEFTAERQARWLAFAEERFGAGIMTSERLEGLMTRGVVTHLLVCRDEGDGNREVGCVLMYLEPPRMAHYYYAFYDLKHTNRSLGLFLMTAAIRFFQDAGFGHLYLGTCYSERALYKTQFEGLEFFDGMAWSTNIDHLKFLVRRDAKARHLLEDPDFLAWHGGLDGLADRTGFQLKRHMSASSPSPERHGTGN
jgi:arginyl-tRNA--protein-N-Asp/Glu arginylyltransferase